MPTIFYKPKLISIRAPQPPAIAKCFICTHDGELVGCAVHCTWCTRRIAGSTPHEAIENWNWAGSPKGLRRRLQNGGLHG